MRSCGPGFNHFRRIQTRWEKGRDLRLGGVALTVCLLIWCSLVPAPPLEKSSGQKLGQHDHLQSPVWYQSVVIGLKVYGPGIST